MAQDREGKETVNETIVIGGDSADIPAGTYPAVLHSTETKTSDAYGDFRAWDFALENGSIVGGASSMNTGKKSKGGRWIAALLGRVPEAKEEVNLIGRACLIVVGEDGNGWPKVLEVLPPLAGSSTTTAEAPPAVASPVPASVPVPAEMP